SPKVSVRSLPCQVLPVHRRPPRLVLVQDVRGDVVVARHLPAEGLPHLVVRTRAPTSVRVCPCHLRCHREPPSRFAVSTVRLDRPTRNDPRGETLASLLVTPGPSILAGSMYDPD